MNVLILHQNFPGQFPHVARHLVRNGHRVVGIGSATAPGMREVPFFRYRIKARAYPHHRFLDAVTEAVHRGNAVMTILRDMKAKGDKPDVILAHPGWGDALYAKDIFPDVRLVSFFEFYYHAQGVDAGFDPEYESDPLIGPSVRSRNMLHLMNLELCDAGISPTHWQKSLHPAHYHNKISVVHEGVNTSLLVPDEEASVKLTDGRVLRKGDPVVTFVARNLEPYRGFHVFMRALPEIQRRNPEAVTVIVGGDSRGYGPLPKDAKSWREKMLAEVGNRLDMSRVVFTGQLPYAHYVRLLQISSAHVYLTYPFVLSWSMLEAMSCGCLVVGSATPPVQEVLTHGVNGLLCDFFDSEKIARSVTAALRRPEVFQPLRRAARETVLEKYSVERGVAEYQGLLEGAVRKQAPESAILPAEFVPRCVGAN